MKLSLCLRAIAAALVLVSTATFAAPALASRNQPPAGPFVADTGVATSNNWTLMPALPATFLNAISMTSVSDGWIVGDGGVSFHYNGSTWNAVPTNQAHNLNSVYAVPGTAEAWAVGDLGTILHFVNGGWTAQTPVSTQQLDSVWMVSTTDGWAVGANGTILHYQGGTWSQVQAGAFTNQFHDVQMRSATDGWAVGEQGTIAHYDGMNWTQVPAPSGATDALFGVWMTSATDGWIVGGANSGPAAIWHLTSGVPSPVSSPVSTRLWYNYMTSPTEGWATGNGGTIIHYTSGSWLFDTTPLTTLPLFGVWLPLPWEGWAVGGDASGSALLHYKAPAPHVVYLPFIAR